MVIVVMNAMAIDGRSAPAPRTVPQPAPVVTNELPKTVKVTFVNATWREVFEWLTEQTGKRVMSCTPDGRFTLVGPPDKEYTIAEVVAAINEELAKQPGHFILIEREKHFSLRCRDGIVGGR
jgi:hypothetical protein